MEIKRLCTETDQRRWSDHVTDNHSCTLYHDLGWKNIIERAYGYKPYYLLAERGKDVVGILPMFLVKDIRWRRALISLPFVPYGGISCHDEDVRERLWSEARRLKEELGVSYVETRSFTPDGIKEDLPADHRYVRSVLKIPGNVSETWQRLNKNRRKKVRKARNNGLSGHVEDAEGALKDFYYLYSRNMRNLGTPVHSIRFFRQVVRELPGRTKIIVVRLEGRAIAASLLLLGRNSLTCGWGASLREHLWCEPNDFLYWEIVRYGCEQRVEQIDFGRSPIGSGSASFKREWGADEYGLEYRYIVDGVRTAPNISVSNPSYARWARLWRRLPLTVADILGPPIRKRVA